MRLNNKNYKMIFFILIVVIIIFAFITFFNILHQKPTSKNLYYKVNDTKETISSGNITDFTFNDNNVFYIKDNILYRYSLEKRTTGIVNTGDLKNMKYISSYGPYILCVADGKLYEIDPSSNSSPRLMSNATKTRDCIGGSIWVDCESGDYYVPNEAIFQGENLKEYSGVYVGVE